MDYNFMGIEIKDCPDLLSMDNEINRIIFEANMQLLRLYNIKIVEVKLDVPYKE